jgi:hypothetical protein
MCDPMLNPSALGARRFRGQLRSANNTEEQAVKTKIKARPSKGRTLLTTKCSAQLKNTPCRLGPEWDSLSRFLAQRLGRDVGKRNITAEWRVSIKGEIAWMHSVMRKASTARLECKAERPGILGDLLLILIESTIVKVTPLTFRMAISRKRIRVGW